MNSIQRGHEIGFSLLLGPHNAPTRQVGLREVVGVFGSKLGMSYNPV
jgi:hypothetical protein